MVKTIFISFKFYILQDVYDYEIDKIRNKILN